MNAKPITISGVLYPSLHAAAEANGIRYATLRRRISYGWPDERLFDPTRERAHPIVIDGVRYSSIADAAKAVGVSENCMYQRITLGMPESKLSKPSHKGSAAKAVRNIDTGEIFASASEAAGRYYVVPNSIYYACRDASRTSAGCHWEYVDNAK